MFNRFYNLKITSKLLVGFAPIIVFLLGISVYAITTLIGISADETNNFNRQTMPIAYLCEMLGDLREARIALRNGIIFSTRGKHQEADENFDKVSVFYSKARQMGSLYEAQIISDSGKAAYRDFYDKMTAFEQFNDITAETAKNGNIDEAITRMTTTGISLGKELDLAREKLQKNKISVAQSMVEMHKDHNATTILFMIIMACLSVIISFISIRLIVRGVKTPLQTLALATGNLAKGDFSSRADIHTHEEFGDLADKFNAMGSQLETMVKEIEQKTEESQRLANNSSAMLERMKSVADRVSGVTEQTASSATQISATTAEMSSTVEDQSHQISGIASAMEEMTSTIADTTSQVTRAMQMSVEATNQASHGGKTVETMADSVNRIAEVVLRSADSVDELGRNSEQIGVIIQTIEPILS